MTLNTASIEDLDAPWQARPFAGLPIRQDRLVPDVADQEDRFLPGIPHGQSKPPGRVLFLALTYDL